VYTLGRGAEAADLLDAPQRLGVPVFRVGRGGGVTFHGPGQLVAYPVVALARQGRDVHRYVRGLEAVLSGVCATFGLAAYTPVGQTGLWIGERKIASIGIAVRRWVTWHGIALNVAVNLDYFRAIVPCAMPALRMTSLQQELGSAPSLEAVEAVVEAGFRRVFNYADAASEEEECV
jgi:lipoate-protein ligase B